MSLRPLGGFEWVAYFDGSGSGKCKNRLVRRRPDPGEALQRRHLLIRTRIRNRIRIRICRPDPGEALQSGWKTLTLSSLRLSSLSLSLTIGSSRQGPMHDERNGSR